MHVKLTTYTKKNKFTSHRQYSLGLCSQEIRRSLTQIRYTTQSEMKQLTNLQKHGSCEKQLHVVGTSCFDNYFLIPYDNWKALLFVKVYCYPDVLFNRYVLAFVEVRITYFISSILIRQLKRNANTKVRKWSCHISHLLNFYNYFDEPRFSL